MYKKTKILYVILFSILTTTITNAQNGSISGKIKTSDGLYAEYINVLILNTTKGTVTNKEGLFAISNISEGNYKLQFSLLGLKTKVIDVAVKANENTKIEDVVLMENSALLEEIIIVAKRLNQFSKKKTKYITRLPLKNINTPQSYSIVTNELMKEQISTDFGTSLKSVTGGNYIESNTGAVSFYARGFRADARIRNGMKFHNRARTPIESQNIERVEVLKGSSSINYGSGFYGGLMNIVTKKPMASDKFELGYNIGSFNLHKINTDFNKAVGSNNEYMFRLNASFYTEDGFQKRGSEIRKHFFVAPAFTYKPSDKFSITINGEFLQGKRNLNFARFIKGVNVKNWSALKLDYNNSYTSKDIAGTFDRSIIQLSSDYHFAENWISQTSFSHSNFGFSEAPYLMTTFLPGQKLLRSIMLFKPEKGGSMNIRQDFVGDYNFDNLQNKTLIGVSFYSDNWEFTRKMLKSTAPKKPAFIDIINLTDSDAKITNLTMDLFNSKPSSVMSQGRKDQNIAGYLSNATTFNMVTVLAGIRYDKFENDATTTNGKKGKDSYDQGKLSYNFGLTINPFNDKIALFGNYMNGFNNQGPGMDKAGKFQNFEPVESKQWETGLKFNLFEGRLKSTFSYYNIDIDNFILSYGRGPKSYQEQNGVVKSKGVEIDVIANPFKGFNIVLGYTYNDAKNIKSNKPNSEGKRLPLTPEQTANFWASYKFAKGNLQGFGLGLGANYVSEIYQVTSYDNTFGAKGYTTIDGTIFYQQPKYKIGIKLNNISNQEYYNAYGIAQKPLNVILGVNYKL